MYTVGSHLSKLQLSEHVSYPNALESHTYCYDHHSGFVVTNAAHNSHAEPVCPLGFLTFSVLIALLVMAATMVFKEAACSMLSKHRASTPLA